MPNLVIEVRQAFRSLLRTKAFFATAMACLALGIGANLAVLSLLDQNLLRPLPFPHSDQLLVIDPVDNQTQEAGPMTMADFLDLQAQCASTQAMAACTARVRTLTGLGDPFQVPVGMVTADFFGVLGVTPALGRVVFRAEEEAKPATVGILRHDLWMKRFGGDPAVLGRTVVLDGKAVQIVGVLPAEFRFFQRIREAQVFTPEAVPFAGRTNRRMGTYLAIGRLHPGVAQGQARTQTQVAAGRMASAGDNAHFGAKVSSLRQRTVAEYEHMLLLFQGAVALILLITCFNVAGLQLVRNLARSQELAIRQALGAGGPQMGRHFLVESLVLGLLGGALGIGLSGLLRLALDWLLKDLIPIAAHGLLSPTMLLAGLGLSLATGAGLAALSWFMARGPRLHEALRTGQRSSHSRSHWRLLKGLVVAEVALSVVLLLGAGLLIRSLLNLMWVDPGFRAEHVLTVDLPLPPQKYTLPVQQAFLRQLEPALKAIPGVAEAGVNDTLPFIKATNGGSVGADPATAHGGKDPQEVYVRWHVISPGYFKAMGIPLLEGATFSPSNAQACILSRRLATRLWPGESALGRTLSSGFPAQFTVVGVVGDTAENSLKEQEAPQFYVPAENYELFGGPVLAVKVQGDPNRYAAQVKGVLRALDPGLAVPEPVPMAMALKEVTLLPRVASILFFTFGALALCLSAVGLYGVLEQITLQRGRELGIRMALGAPRSRVVQGLLAGAGVLVALGVAAGVLLGWELSLLLAPLLFQASGLSAAICLGVLTLVLPTALIACLLPALRATGVSPAQALRAE